MRTITLEEHFVTKDFLKATGAFGDHMPPEMQQMRSRLLDLDAGRIAAMDEGGVDLQVLSLAALEIEKLAAAEETAVLSGVHDELAAAVKAHPGRFAAFATPGLKEPEKGAKELERCVRELGFKGAMLDGTTDGKFLDDPRFFPVLEAADALGVPVYVHPAPPPEPVRTAYYSNLPGQTGFMLSIAGWGWHSETCIHILRLVLSGVMDRLPKLQIIVGHMGEGLPYAFARTNQVFAQARHLKRSVAETFTDQFHVTTSGYFTRPPFDCAKAVIGLERLMYSVDYPFSPNTKGRQFLQTLELGDEDLAWLCHGHAEKLLRL